MDMTFNNHHGFVYTGHIKNVNGPENLANITAVSCPTIQAD